MIKKPFTLAGQSFSSSGQVLVVAEAGTGHEGDPDRMEALIRAAKQTGADAVKFQMVFAHEILHPATGIVELPGGPVRLFDRFRSLEQNRSFYETAVRLCREEGLLFLCSPFGLESEALLAALDPPAIKIASPELNHFPLIRKAASRGLPLIFSTGVSRMGDIEAALEAAEEGARETTGTNAITPDADIALLHCVTSYPAPEEEYNLRTIKTLAAAFGLPVGVSDHSSDPALVPVLAVSQGACIIEKHICLSAAGDGLDDPVALEPDAFSDMVQEVRRAQGLPEDKILSYMANAYGPDRVRACLGTGIKRLAASERDNYGRTNRSLHYMDEFPAGYLLTPEDIAILRTEKILSPGIGPEYLETVTGLRLTRPVKAGAGVRWEDLVSRG